MPQKVQAFQVYRSNSSLSQNLLVALPFNLVYGTQFGKFYNYNFMLSSQLQRPSSIVLKDILIYANKVGVERRSIKCAYILDAVIHQPFVKT